MFTPGDDYTRREIHAYLGGSVISCLPTSNGTVVAACLSKKFSPGAPEVMLCGRGARTTPISALFSRQKTAVPMFIKSGSNRWQYRGRFKVDQSFSSGERFESFIVGSGRSVASVSYVIILERSALND